jgi:hypothetical protein
MKRKLLKKTTKWVYEDRVVIHSMTKHKSPDLIYFSNPTNPIEKWDNEGWVDIEKAPKLKFITRFKNVLWNKIR